MDYKKIVKPLSRITLFVLIVCVIYEIVKLLKGDGDFRSEECIDRLKKADIVVQLDKFWKNAKIFALRLNSDSHDDFILLNAVSDQWIDGILLLSVE